MLVVVVLAHATDDAVSHAQYSAIMNQQHAA